MGIYIYIYIFACDCTRLIDTSEGGNVRGGGGEGYNSITKINLQLLKTSHPALAERLLNPLTSLELTTLIFKSKKPTLNKTADFMHRIIEKSLPTRNKIYTDFKSNINKDRPLPQKNRHLKTYNHPFCIPCLYLDNTLTIEDTQHIFTDCPYYNNSQDSLTQTILQIINKNTSPDKTNSMPFWFSTQNNYNSAFVVDNHITDFPKLLGDMGYIPAGLKTWIKFWFPHLKNKNKTLKQIAIASQQHVHNKWLTRCELHFSLIKYPFVMPAKVVLYQNKVKPSPIST